MYMGTHNKRQANRTANKTKDGKIHNLRYRDHTLPYFVKSSILQLPELVEHATLCYVQSGIHQDSPYNIKALWNVREQTRTDLRDQGIMLAYPVSHKEYINTLPALEQAKIWDNKHDKYVKEGKPLSYKQTNKQNYIMEYISKMTPEERDNILHQTTDRGQNTTT